MVVFKSGETRGIVAYVKEGKAFRFVRTSMGDVFISPSVVGDCADELVQGAEVKLNYETSNRGLVATKLVSILPPVSERFHEGIVKFFNGDKGYGFIESADFGDKDVFVHATVCARSDIKLFGEMTVEFTVEEVDDKLRATTVRLARQKRTSAKPKKSTEKPMRGKRRTPASSKAAVMVA